MTKLEWTPDVNKPYESGVSNGVLYLEEGSGVVWNGLVSVQEAYVGGETDSFYFDGIKYLDVMYTKVFQATIRAFSAPAEFEPCLGEVSPRPGFILTGQQKIPFNFSYKTLLGDELGYKIHLVYNAVATRTKQSYETLAKSPTPSLLEWRIDTVPVDGETYRPFSHLILDSRHVSEAGLEELEAMFYGTSTTDPTLPSAEDVITIVDNSDILDGGTFAYSSPGVVDGDLVDGHIVDGGTFV